MTTLLNKPLTSLKGNKYLQEASMYNVLDKPKTSTKYTPNDIGLFVAMHLFTNSGELLQDKESMKIHTRTEKIMREQIKEDDLYPLSIMFNECVNTLNNDNYNVWNQTVTGLFLMDMYLTSKAGSIIEINNRPLHRLIKKQLGYISNGDSKIVMRGSKLFAENILRYFGGGVEVAKTLDEIKEALRLNALKRRVTVFGFNGKEFRVNGEHLTLEECINRFCEKRYQVDYRTFKDRNFFIKKYKVSHSLE